MVVAVVAVVALLGGLVVTGVLGAPSVTGVENRFGGVNETATTVESSLQLSNPNPVGVSLGGLTADYEIRMNGIKMASGTKSGVDVETGESALPLTTFLDNERIPAWWVSHVTAGEETTLRVNADVHSSLLGASFDTPKIERTVETDIVSAFDSTERRPVNAGLPVVSDPVLYVEETSGEWGTVDANRTEVETSFLVSNPKPYPVAVTQVGYEIRMNGIVMGEGVTDREYVIPPGGERRINATTVMRTPRFDEWWVSHLERDQTTTLVIDFALVVDPRTPGAESVRIPLDSLEQTIETDIFGNDTGGESQNESAGGTATRTQTPGGESTPTPTPSTTPTPAPTDGGLLDGESTPTPTPTENETTAGTPTPSPSPTPSPTPTPTDDGIL